MYDDRIYVTQNDIKYGKAVSCRLCPIATAVCRRFAKGFGSVMVGGSCVKIGRKFFALPKSARKFIGRFDRGETVKPFSFKFATSVAKQHKESA